MNTVEELLRTPFLDRTHEEKLQLKLLGPHQPDVKMEQRTKAYTRRFTAAWYEKKKWLCGCPLRKALFCFPCLLFGGDSNWTKKGVNDLKHIAEKIKKHDTSKSHLDNSLKLVMFGRVNIATQLDERYRVEISKHNMNVDKNRYILSKIIDCIRFCGAFELALRAQDEVDCSSNPEIFSGLVDFVSSIDSAMETHLRTTAVFQGSSRAIQRELLDCMLDITREFIVQQLRRTEYVAVQVDNTSDVSPKTQSALVFRYIDEKCKLVERFYCFTFLQDSRTKSIATALLGHLHSIFPEQCNKAKVIAQTYDGAYDGASVMHGEAGGLQRKVRTVYPNAHYVHGYAHQLTLIVQQVTSKIPQVRSFFCDLSGFPSFFIPFPKRTKVLEDIVTRRLPGQAPVRWDFNSPKVNIVYVYREDLFECFKTIEHCGHFESTAICGARGLTRVLGDKEFLFFLFLFHDIMAHVDALYNQLQKQDIDTTSVHRATEDFASSIYCVRECVEQLGCRLPENSMFPSHKMDIKTLNQVAKEVCDILVVHIKGRFTFTKHLVSAKLLRSKLFESHDKSFPVDAVIDALGAYPTLNRERLNTELSLIYSRPEFCHASGGVALFRFFVENHLQEAFSETVKLLRIILTTPMVTAEPECCFSTLKNIKTFLRNTMNQDGLNALAMLSLEKQLIREITDFNKQTIEKFAALKNRQAAFMYKL
ncbi:protein zwilch homolog isoform X1 [Pleurodeles waltl]|uniref:protein zwilch homolog isoform X1 n=1 Tax=Pleurodeles waltl TaxID=8319 RepID=UPI003709AA00